MVSIGSKSRRLIALVLVMVAAGVVLAQALENSYAPAERKWEVHDMNRPEAKVIVPGTASTPEKAGTAPSDAVVLFDGKDLSAWVVKIKDKKTGKEEIKPAPWKVENGYMEVAPKSGSIQTKKEFGSCQLHVEWASPNPPSGEGQSRGNSGVYLMGCYELQILDSYGNRTYADGQAGSIYGQNPPQVNPCLKPGEWQTYDLIFHRPRFDAKGKCVKPATITVFYNGVLVQDNHTIWGAVAHKKVAVYRPHPDKAPLSLQDHSYPVRFRNIWIREIPDGDEQP